MYHYNIDWLDERSRTDLIDNLFSALYEWTNEVVEEFAEFPTGYSEWTLAGHLAVAASRIGFYPVQEYSIPRRDTGRARPDLHIRGRDEGEECLFELKKDDIGLGQRRYIDSKIVKGLRKGWDQVTRFPVEESRRLCSLLGITVWTHAAEWKRMCKTPQSYGRNRNLLWGSFHDGVEKARWEHGGRTYSPNICCGYFLSHEKAEEHLDYSRLSEDPIPVGLIWAGMVRRTL